MFEGPSTQLVFPDGPHVGLYRFPRLPGVALEGPKNAPSEAQEGPEREKPYKTSSKSNVFVYSPLGFGGPPGVLRCFGEGFCAPPSSSHGSWRGGPGGSWSSLLGQEGGSAPTSVGGTFLWAPPIDPQTPPKRPKRVLRTLRESFKRALREQI